MRNTVLFLIFPTQKKMQIIAQDAHMTLKELKQEYQALEAEKQGDPAFLESEMK